MLAESNEKIQLDWLYSTQLFGVKLGLENTARLLRELELPAAGQKFIHVAGTNGKGSVCAFVHSLLNAAGASVGLFTSPHPIQFRERIRDQERMINREETAQGLARLRDKVKDWDPHPTFFELTFVLAMEWFARRQTEWVVLETGMGGRLDATNALLPEVTVITSVSLDHQQVLGHTLAEIATEKAGIIKPGVPVLTVKQAPEVMEVISRVARQRGAPLTIITTPVRGYELGLAGQHQLWNAALAVAALKVLGFKLPDPVLRHGLKSVHWPARFQPLESGRLILDGAHHIDAAETLVRTWLHRYPGEKASIIFGSTLSKDIRAIIRALQPIAASWHFTGFQSPRAAPPEQLREVQASAFGNAVETHVHASPPGALIAARQGKERVLITGSLYLAGEVLAHMRGEDAIFQCSAQ